MIGWELPVHHRKLRNAASSRNGVRLDWRGRNGIRRAGLDSNQHQRWRPDAPLPIGVHRADCLRWLAGFPDARAQKQPLKLGTFRPLPSSGARVERQIAKLNGFAAKLNGVRPFRVSLCVQTPWRAFPGPPMESAKKRWGGTLRHRPVLSVSADQAARDFITFRAVMILRAASLVTNRSEESLKVRMSHLFNSPSPS